MKNTLLTPQDVANELKISKYTVYEIIKRKELHACRVGNKLRIEPEELERYKNTSRSGAPVFKSPFPSSAYAAPDAFGAAQPAGLSQKRFVLSGQDPLLDTLCRYLARPPVGINPGRAYENSYQSLYSLYKDEIQMAAIHIWDGRTNQYNVPCAERMLPGIPASVIRFARRVQGFYVLKGNPKNILAWEDLKRRNITYINREVGSGSRILLDEHLKRMGLARNDLPGYFNECLSPMAQVNALLHQTGDVGLGLEMPFLPNLEIDFIPLQKEYYDLVIKKETMQSPVFQAMLSILRSPEFRMEMHGIAGYDLSEAGTIVAEI